MLQNIKGLIFDLGDTLIFFDDSLAKVMDQADCVLADSLETNGVITDRDSFLKSFRTRMREYYEERDTEFVEHTTYTILQQVLAEMGITKPVEDILRKCLKEMYAVFQAHWQPVPGGVTILSELKRRGYQLALVSNSADDGNVQFLVDKIQARPFFDFVITSAAKGIRKPNPRIFQPVLAGWNLAPQNVAMVGDTLGADILGAKNAGLFSIWVTQFADTPGNRSHLDTIEPDLEIENLAQLLNVFNSPAS
jgi:HAD superfamily hydrolase (TIGR01662 family)